MQVELEASKERRRYPRSPINSRVLVSLPGNVCEYELRNLSAGGARLSGGPPLELGSMIDLILRLPGCAVMRVEAEVVNHDRRADGRLSMGVVFHHESDAVQDSIQAALLAELEAAAASVGAAARA